MKVVDTFKRAVIAAGTVIGVAALATAAVIGIGGFPPSRADAAGLTPPVSATISADVPVAIAATRAAHRATSGLTAVSDRAETRAGAYTPLATDRRIVAWAFTTPRSRAVVAKRLATPSLVRRTVSRRAVASHPAPRPTGGTWRSARVSWYGPGFYGHTMAGGGRLQTSSMIVASRTLAFGTRVQFTYHGHSVIAVVRDRGPYVSGRTFDLGPGTARALGFSGVGTVRYRIL